MKSIILQCAAFCFMGLIIGCDKTYSVDYVISNDSGENISICIDYFETKKDSSDISDGTKLIFFNDFGIGFSSKDYMDGIEMIPFEISIFNANGVMYNKEEVDLSNWTKLYPDKPQGIGKIQLMIRPEDFE